MVAVRYGAASLLAMPAQHRGDDEAEISSCDVRGNQIGCVHVDPVCGSQVRRGARESVVGARVRIGTPACQLAALVANHDKPTAIALL